MQKTFSLTLLLLLLLCTCALSPSCSPKNSVGTNADEPASTNTADPAALQPTLRFERLLCDYVENPQVIASKQPRFSWVVDASGFDRYQTAYRLLVATAPGVLAKNEGDIWDTGKRTSARSAHNAFEGHALTPGTTYYWKVKIWDEADTASPWSAVQSFTTGIEDEASWAGARWITVPADERSSEHRFRDVKNSRMAAPLRETSFPAGYFRTTFTARKKVAAATAYVAGLGYYEVYLNGEKVGDQVLDPAPSNYDKTAYYAVLDASKEVREQENTLVYDSKYMRSSHGHR